MQVRILAKAVLHEADRAALWTLGFDAAIAPVLRPA
jgi:hypothetical protein